MNRKFCLLFPGLLFLLSGCFSLRSGPKDLSGYPLISNPSPKSRVSGPFSLQMKTVIKFRKESFSMIQILSADPCRGFYHCQMLTPFGVKCLEFTCENGVLKDLFIFPALEKLNRNNRLFDLLSEALEKIFNVCESEKAVFHQTPEGNTGILIRGKNALYLKTDPVLGNILEKKYFIRNKNVVNISFLNNAPSELSTFSGTIHYSHLKSGLEMELKRIPSE